MDDVLIVALTGYGSQLNRQRSKEAGFDDHLTKPVDLDILGGLLEGLRTRGR